MKKITLLFLLFTFCNLVYSQETYVPDDNFEAYLEANSMGNGIANDNYVTTANITSVTSLIVSGLSIGDLTGIEGFAALTTFNCGNNSLISLDVSQNTALEYLDCGNNSLTSLDVSQNTTLINLECYINSLTSLDVSQNAALTYLDCRSNDLSNLNVSGNTTVLTTLYCANNNLTSLDVSQNTALEYLYCNDNQLTGLNVKNGNNTNISDFEAYNNPALTCIQVDNATYSTNNWPFVDAGATFSEECHFGETYVPDDNFEAYLEANSMGNSIANDNYVTTANIASVTSLNVTSQSIGDLTGIEDFAALTNLRCQSNNLTSLDVSTNIALTFLWCQNNNLSSLDISTNTVLENFQCGNNNLSNLDVSTNTALTSLLCQSNNLSSLDVSSNTALTRLTYYSNNISSIDVSTNTALTRLECYSNNISSLDVSSNTALTYLRCDNNNISSLDVSTNTALTSLYCYNNNISNLNVSTNTVLEYFQCSNNNLSSLDVSSNPALTTLICNNNNLTGLNLDVRNGNNGILTTFNATSNNVNLCIQVDDEATIGGTWTKDATATYTDAGFCDSLGVTDVILHDVAIYPNPTNNMLTISLKDTLQKIEVFTLHGQKVMEHTSVNINISNLASGMYLLKIYTTNGGVTTKKILKL